jgi:glutaredoxin
MKQAALAVLLTLALALAWGAGAQTLYKSIGPDGKAVYSDKPPAQGQQLQKTLKAESLPNTALPPGMAEELARLRASGAAKPAAAAKDRPVLFAASWCGYCRQARAYLARAGIRHEDIDIDTPQGKAAFAAAGGGGVPLLVMRGETLRGYSELAYDSLFARQR